MIVIGCLLLLHVCTANLDTFDVTRENHERSGPGSQCSACPIASYSSNYQGHHHHDYNDWYICVHNIGSHHLCDHYVDHCMPFLGERILIQGSNYLKVDYKNKPRWALEVSVRCENDCCNGSLNSASATGPTAIPTIPTTTTTTVITTKAPENLKVRLVDGPTALEGRVEVFRGGSWGTVCDDGWDDESARVVCGMLGYSSVHATHTSKARYGSGQGHIWLDETQCSGHETNLGQCSFVPYGHGDCDHSEDAGVICQAMATTTTTTTAASTPVPRESLKVRLVDGPSAREGRVEVLHDHVWGTVCDDSWDDDDAKVVCRMLGYNSFHATHTSKARYGSGQGPIWLDETQCSGHETNLGQCSFVPYGHGDCDHSEDAGVICQATTTTTAATKPTSTQSAIAATTSGHWVALAGASTVVG